MSALVPAIGGALAPFLLPTALPDYTFLFVAVTGVFVLLIRVLRPCGVFLLAIAWSLMTIQLVLNDRLDPAMDGRHMWVTGVIASMPVARGDSAEFLFEPHAGTGAAHLPGRIRVRWYKDVPDLYPGEIWRLELRLRPPRSRINFSGPDTERWYFSQRIGALATVQGAENLRLAVGRGAYLERVRHTLRDRISETLRDHPARGLVLALAIADRSEIAPSDWQNLTVTGTGHLLAISGMHIGLASLFGFWAGRLLSMLMSAGLRLRSGLLPAWICALGSAIAYAALAGFGTSTRRALIMLLVLCFTQLSRRFVHPARAFLIALAAVLLAEPLAPLQAGFWFSFTAVGVLMLLFSTRNGPMGRIHALLLAQSGITVVMLPFGMYWFQQGTALGLLTNLVAIPWVSFVVVPLVLAGALFSLCGIPLAGHLLRYAADAGEALAGFLSWVSNSAPFGSIATARPGVASSVLAVTGVLLLLLPRGLPIRWLAPFLVIPILLPRPPEIDPGEAHLELLDVGQGLAALVRTRRRSLLYDSGPGQPGVWDLTGSVIRPAVAAAGFRGPDRIIISHGDLDHAGGLAGLLHRYPRAEVHANLDRDRIHCTTELRWEWDEVRFRVLHPGPGLPYLGNSSSCVLSVYTQHGALLLTGDIGSAVEARLVDRDIGPHEVVVAPHHGSKTSSSPALIRQAAPALVLFSAGSGNRFGFPDSRVLQRYLNAGAGILSTSDCGAIRVRMSGLETLQVSTARRSRKAMWRWPPKPHCP